MTEARLRLGAWGEEQAAAYLCRRGFKILARNLRTRSGEVDILAQPPAPDDRLLVIVEVKTRARRTDDGYPPEWRVGRAKQQKLTILAAQIARKQGWTGRPIRFDIIAVEAPDGADPAIRHLVAAFESRA